VTDVKGEDGACDYGGEPDEEDAPNGCGDDEEDWAACWDEGTVGTSESESRSLSGVISSGLSCRGRTGIS